jgi:hypothetical protein
MVKVPDTGVAALKAVGPEDVMVLSPACDAVIVQLPVLLSVTLAEEMPLPSIDELPTEQDPEVLKLTSC